MDVNRLYRPRDAVFVDIAKTARIYAILCFNAAQKSAWMNDHRTMEGDTPTSAKYMNAEMQTKIKDYWF